jgi:hypothetical protein
MILEWAKEMKEKYADFVPGTVLEDILKFEKHHIFKS